MFVKKFEADTLEEALKAVKVELGPDAIILKTVTNNGLKGAFKKKRIEITAAISEKSYEKKAKVDKVLNNEQKEAFYQRPASVIKETITKYNGDAAAAGNPGYGSMGLNRVVNTLAKGSAGLSDITTKTSSLIKNSLDDFLTDGDEGGFDVDSADDLPPRPVATRGKYSEPPSQGEETPSPRRSRAAARRAPEPEEEMHELSRASVREPAVREPAHREPPREAPAGVGREAYNELRQELRTTQHKLELLEHKLLELSQNYQFNQKHLNEAKGIFQLRTTLKTLDVDEAHILELIKKANYQLSKEDLENPDVIFEFALQEMASSINTAIPLFARTEAGEPVVTVLLSEAASGQSTMGTKIAVLKKDVVLVQYSQDAQNTASTDFAAQVFGIKVEKVQSFAEVVGLCRKATEAGKSVLVDIRLNNRNTDETKKFVDTLKRGLAHVEVLCTLSAIHSELYNRKIIARYKDAVDGVIISHVDLCMNFGALFNVHKVHNKLPLKFFGTGPVVPDDIEGATAERLMAGLFQF
jgi:flagellar biosynthesis protein FlhF